MADKANALWVADITYVPTWAGFLYLAVPYPGMDFAFVMAMAFLICGQSLFRSRMAMRVRRVGGDDLGVPV